jgi:hypothetical protein
MNYGIPLLLTIEAEAFSVYNATMTLALIRPTGVIDRFIEGFISRSIRVLNLIRVVRVVSSSLGYPAWVELHSI